MKVDITEIVEQLKTKLGSVRDSFEEQDRDAVVSLLDRYSELAVRQLNGEDVSVSLAAVKTALTNYKVGATSNASNVARQLAMDVFMALITKIL